MYNMKKLNSTQITQLTNLKVAADQGNDALTLTDIGATAAQINRLITLGVVVKNGVAKSGGRGRPSVLYTLTASGVAALGTDVPVAAEPVAAEPVAAEPVAVSPIVEKLVNEGVVSIAEDKTLDAAISGDPAFSPEDLFTDEEADALVNEADESAFSISNLFTEEEARDLGLEVLAHEVGLPAL